MIEQVKIKDVLFQEKVDKLFWILKIRFITPITLWVVMMLGFTSRPNIRSITIFSGILVIYLIYTGLNYIHLKRIKHYTKGKRTQVNLNMLATVQLLVDIVLLTLIIYFDGGIESHMVLLYVFVLVVAAVIVDAYYGYFLYGCMSLFYLGLIFGEMTGYIAHQSERGDNINYYQEFGVVLSDAISVVFLLGLLFYFTRYLTKESRLLQDAFREALKKYSKVKKKYDDLFDSVNDLIVSIDAQGTILYVNNKWREVLGYTKSDTKKLNFSDILCRECEDEFKNFIAPFEKGERERRFRTVFITKDRERIQVEGNLSAKVVDSELVSLRGIFRDITKQVEAEKERENEQEKLKEFNKILIGREHKMIEMKDEIKRLKKENDTLMGT